MEKKSLPDKYSPSAQLYKPVQFEDDPRRSLEKQKQKEESKKAEAVKQEKEGYEKGHAAGYEKGLQDGAKAVQERLSRCEKIIIELGNYREQKIEELMPQLIELSLEIAKKIIHREIDLDRNVIMHVAQDAIKKVGEKEENIIIKVNPLDYEVMVANIDLLKEESGVKKVTVEPLASITPGGCYIETQTSEIDANVEEQIKEVSNAISTAVDS